MTIKKKSMVEGITQDLDEPIDVKLPFLKKGRIRCVILFEDGSFSEYFKKLSDAYFMTIKHRKYLIVPKCILNGKFPSIFWYFNNPSPIFFEFKRSTLKAENFYSKTEWAKLPEEKQYLLSNVHLDSESIDASFDNRLLRGLYGERGVTAKTIIIFLIVGVVILLLILHFTGVINIMEILGVAKK